MHGAHFENDWTVSKYNLSDYLIATQVPSSTSTDQPTLLLLSPLTLSSNVHSLKSFSPKLRRILPHLGFHMDNTLGELLDLETGNY